MSKAWVSRETIDPTTGKRKREKMAPGLAGVGPNDRFVVFYLAPPDNRQKQERIGILGRPGKKAADRRADEITAQLVSGTYEAKNRQTWQDFRKEYDATVLEGMETATRSAVSVSLSVFERICRPKAMAGITSKTISDFIAKRRKEKGSRGKAELSVATVNRDLRHLRAVLRVAHKWKYLPEVPDIPFLKEPQKTPTYAPPEDFAKMYAACDEAKYPVLPNTAPADWWRGVLVIAMMTGWRIAQILSLRWDHVDLEGGYLFAAAQYTKGRRDVRIELHQLAKDHLIRLKDRSFDPHVFPWPMNRRTLWTHFQRIQKVAGVKPAKWMRIEHYGFHDLRRAFGTLNAERLTADALQQMMQHRSYVTTQRYINMAKQMKSAVDNLFVPPIETEKTG